MNIGNIRNKSKEITPSKPPKKTLTLGPMLTEISDIKELKKKSELSNLYKLICDNINMDKGIIPELDFEEYDRTTLAIYDCRRGKIYFNINNLENLNKKKTIWAIRHELEHAKQFQNIMRKLGLKRFTNLILIKNENWQEFDDCLLDDINAEYYKKVERKLGKIPPESAENIIVQKYIDAFKCYPNANAIIQRPDISPFKKILLSLKCFIQYKTNLLEKDANKAAKKFLKTFLK